MSNLRIGNLHREGQDHLAKPVCNDEGLHARPERDQFASVNERLTFVRAELSKRLQQQFPPDPKEKWPELFDVGMQEKGSYNVEFTLYGPGVKGRNGRGVGYPLGLFSPHYSAEQLLGQLSAAIQKALIDLKLVETPPGAQPEEPTHRIPGTRC